MGISAWRTPRASQNLLRPAWDLFPFFLPVIPASSPLSSRLQLISCLSHPVSVTASQRTRVCAIPGHPSAACDRVAAPGPAGEVESVVRVMCPPCLTFPQVGRRPSCHPQQATDKSFRGSVAELKCVPGPGDLQAGGGLGWGCFEKRKWAKQGDRQGREHKIPDSDLWARGLGRQD